MTLLISAFGFAGRFAGDLLTTALGWASSLLFGRVPRSHQIFLVAMMAGSFLWLVVMLSLVLPSVGSFLLAATPHAPFMNDAWLGWVLLVAAVVLPLLIGLAGYLVPSGGERLEGLAAVGEVLRGYLLAPLIAGLLIWLAGVGVARKIRSKRHGWSDIHVAIVVEPDGYEQVARVVEEATGSANLDLAVREPPKAVTVPAWLLTRVAGENVRRMRPDHLRELTGRHLRIGIFPSDIAISGSTGSRTLARAAILSRLVTADAHLTTSKEAQEVEDDLRKIARSRAGSRAAFDRIDERLLDLEVPTDEWDILYRLRLQIDRDLLLGVEPGTTFPGDADGDGRRDGATDNSAAGGNPTSDARERARLRRSAAASRSAPTPS